MEPAEVGQVGRPQVLRAAIQRLTVVVQTQEALLAILRSSPHLSVAHPRINFSTTRRNLLPAEEEAVPSLSLPVVEQ
jgi:hypothetical protein